MSQILKITDLKGGYKEDVNILCGISLEVKQGEAVGIIGLNGSGKSTFGKAIMNMIPYRRGEFVFEGEDITSLTTSQLSQRGISIMQQGGRVFKNLSVWDNLQLALSRQSSNNLDKLKDIIPMLQQSKKDLQRTMADKLSGGQKHQLSLAMTLASNPRLVILDEPSAGLSPKAVEEMYKMMQSARDMLGITTVLIEQNVSYAIKFCEVCVMISSGKITQSFRGDILNMSEIESLMYKLYRNEQD